jgi:hypothetical protein
MKDNSGFELMELVLEELLRRCPVIMTISSKSIVKSDKR